MNSLIDQARLANWKTAGYQNGQPVPSRPSTISYPEGRIIIDARLSLPSNTVLRGAGIGKTVLIFPRSLYDVVGVGSDGGDWGWAYGGGFFQATNSSEIGIEDITIEFPGTPYPGHLHEKGFNGISFAGSTNCWIKNVEIIDMDSGVFIEKETSHVTIDNLILRTAKRGRDQSHHGLEMQRASYCLARNIDWRTTFIHDYSLERASFNVLRDSKGIDFCLDHHLTQLDGTTHPHHNLVTNMDFGDGTRPYKSGGTYYDSQMLGDGETLWNCYKRIGGQKALLTQAPPNWKKYIIVGFYQAINTVDRFSEIIQPNIIDPQNLHDYQLGIVSLPPVQPTAKERAIAKLKGLGFVDDEIAVLVNT